MIKSTYTLDKVEALESASPASCKTLATFIDSIRSKNEPKKAKNLEMRSNFKQIVLYCFGLCIQNPGIREEDLKTSPNRSSDKINMQEQGRKFQKIGLTFGSQQLQR